MLTVILRSVRTHDLDNDSYQRPTPPNFRYTYAETVSISGSTGTFPNKFPKFIVMVTYLSLIFQIFPNLAGGKIPNLNESIYTACDQILTIWGESCTFYMRLLTKLEIYRKKIQLYIITNI